MRLKTRIIAFILMLLTVFYAIPVSVFADVAFFYKPSPCKLLNECETDRAMPIPAYNNQICGLCAAS